MYTLCMSIHGACNHCVTHESLQFYSALHILTHHLQKLYWFFQYPMYQLVHSFNWVSLVCEELLNVTIIR